MHGNMVGSFVPRPQMAPVELVSKVHVYPCHILRENRRSGSIPYPDELGGSVPSVGGVGGEVIDNERGGAEFTLPSTTPS